MFLTLKSNLNPIYPPKQDISQTYTSIPTNPGTKNAGSGTAVTQMRRPYKFPSLISNLPGPNVMEKLHPACGYAANSSLPHSSPPKPRPRNLIKSNYIPSLSKSVYLRAQTLIHPPCFSEIRRHDPILSRDKTSRRPICLNPKMSLSFTQL